MHIPDSMLNGSVCPVTAIVSSVGVVAASVFAARKNSKNNIERFAAVTALIFAGQMLNFPVMNGTSGHLLGGVLAAVMLGIPWGMLSIMLVVSIQALVFGDGGVAVLGANVLNMALIGACGGGLLYEFLNRRFKKTIGSLGAVAIAAWASVVLASLAASIELAWAGTATFAKCAPAMIQVHSLIGLGEAAITVGAVYLFGSYRETDNLKEHNVFAAPALTAVFCALVLSPFACGWADGLEHVSEKLGIMKEAQPLFVAPLADYVMPNIKLDLVSVSMAGLVGVILCLFFGWAIAKVLLPVKNR
jgi:cobalt/nickel transport system permease protein